MPPVRRKGEFVTTNSSFTIMHPARDAEVQVESASNFRVRVNNTGDDDRFDAWIFFVGSGTGMGQGVTLTQEGTSTLWSGLVPSAMMPTMSPGPGPANNNRTVTVKAFRGSAETTTKQHDFAGYDPAGGGGGGGNAIFAASHRYRFFPPDTPLPVAVVLHLHGEVSPGRYRICHAVNQPVTLLHDEAAHGACRWVSGPLNLDGGSPAFWVLELTDAHTWELTLGHGDARLAAYRCHREAGWSFPVELGLESNDPGAFLRWPKTSTIYPG